MGAVFGQRYGWERANWFAPPGGAICLSLSWSFASLPRDISALSLAIGVCALRGMAQIGVTGAALLQRVPEKGTILPERKIRAKLVRMVKNKYKRTCPNCGHCFDMFQPAHMLRTIEPG